MPRIQFALPERFVFATELQIYISHVNQGGHLDNAQLLPKVGACTQCPKRTGANPELWDKAGADVCTDTACFADKKEAHYDALKAEAQAKGRKIITGREARELMPTEGATPKGYILLDKPKKGDTEPMRQVLGQEGAQRLDVVRLEIVRDLAQLLRGRHGGRQRAAKLRGENHR